MFSRFQKFIEDNNLINTTDKILLAVSGGVDSMVMLHLYRRLGVHFEVAHCNFHLRGEESDADERFVVDYCNLNHIPIHVAQFQTKDYANQKKLSIELAARDLRYNYFGKLCVEVGCNKISVAHNLNDSAETVIQNLSRGTGIKGLTGIRPINGNIIRPLLFATRSEIEEYAKQNNLDYRIDSTNADIVFRRNYIRHRILPELRTLNPSVDSAIAKTAVHLQQALLLVNRQLQMVRSRVITNTNGIIQINVDALRNEQCEQLFMVEELGHFGFSPQQAECAADLVNMESGRRIDSATHTIYRNRESLVIAPLDYGCIGEVEIAEGTTSINAPVNLNFEFLSGNIVLDKRSCVAQIDYDKLKFPLILRRWRSGDRFIPLGMKNFKKISDMLIDNKVPLHEKNNVYVLTSAHDIVWVVGIRLDNRYKVGKKTSNILKISML